MRTRSEIIAGLIVKNQYKNIVEVGVSRGDNARAIRTLLANLNHQLNMFWLVDLPEYLKKPIYEFNHHGLVEPHIPNVRYISKDSLSAAEDFVDASMDLVFLDANHNQEAFIRDIQAWLPKLRIGGILCGDEYGATGGHSCAYRTELLNGLFANLEHEPEVRQSEGQQTEMWWIKKG